jgi:hypothetical protein
MKRSVLIVFLAVIALVGWCSLPRETKRGQVEHESLDSIRIFAYRDWQSTGLRVHQDDVLTIEAEGSWLYTPEEYHGPGGHRRFGSPDFYPLPGVPGGALIGRIGEEGEPFYVGERARRQVQRDGLLYLRIDDDILSDNEGYVTVQVEVTRPDQAG